ncbi:glycosyltransferase family 39 protein [Flavobacterium sp.]|jgi:hypothetical protein|uniref:glycosyltransferase family 39 protein n=1 Tax=Flavobacterium sp. TaxID=239 RepID=UPI0037BF4C69
MIVVSRNTLLFWLIMGFVLLVKGYFLFNTFHNGDFSETTISKSGDAGHYFKIAKNISEFQSYADNSTSIANESATWRPPVWPFTLSLFFYITSNPLVLLFLKVGFETLTLISIIWFFSKKNNYSIVFFGVLLLLLIEPQYLKYSATFLSESFTAVLALLLTFLFLDLRKDKSYHILIPIIAGLTVLSHPVSVFFVVTLFCIYLLCNVKNNLKKCFIHGILFSVIVLSWPIRNAVVFHKGLYLTASQGATFAKGWNEKVITDFTNVDGDLADESLNLKYVNPTDLKESGKGVLEYSQLYQKGTWNFIKSLSFSEQINIAFKKLKSNFNPFPEKPKAGFFERLSVVFRILYLVTFSQLLARIISRKKFDFNSQRDKAFAIVLAVLLGQTLMSIYIYTGFRFNAVYSLTLLLCFILINHHWATDKIYRFVKK